MRTTSPLFLTGLAILPHFNVAETPALREMSAGLNNAAEEVGFFTGVTARF